MAHHAFFVAGEREEGITAALRFLEAERGLGGFSNPDIIIERHGLLKAEDARRLADKTALSAVGPNGKALVIAVNRFFHEAQNILLKTFEEPPEGTTLIVVIPNEGDLIPTMRSRVQPLPGSDKSEQAVSPEAEEFWNGSKSVRQKVVEAILKEAKSDDEDDKLEARAKARGLGEGLAVLAHREWRKRDEGSLVPFLHDLDRLIPVLTDRAAPLKPILEHLLITAPKQ